jgi:hypothetical protein
MRSRVLLGSQYMSQTVTQTIAELYKEKGLTFSAARSIGAIPLQSHFNVQVFYDSGADDYADYHDMRLPALS